ncbi:hypothetical protein ADUPG1_006831 [Aduncisulcus paluster]|uniref:Uncharacterized protein n=1 Tax=Aduncisulcus paluster TaxID=2918883 RepID=A0ABQ5KJT6_9EUKA|nr:hypothetical protein ADUPG1_006831 [Aduncisulcus paluster]
MNKPKHGTSIELKGKEKDSEIHGLLQILDETRNLKRRKLDVTLESLTQESQIPQGKKNFPHILENYLSLGKIIDSIFTHSEDVSIQFSMIQHQIRYDYKFDGIFDLKTFRKLLFLIPNAWNIYYGSSKTYSRSDESNGLLVEQIKIRGYDSNSKRVEYFKNNINSFLEDKKKIYGMKIQAKEGPESMSQKIANHLLFVLRFDRGDYDEGFILYLDSRIEKVALPPYPRESPFSKIKPKKISKKGASSFSRLYSSQSGAAALSFLAKKSSKNTAPSILGKIRHSSQKEPLTQEIPFERERKAKRLCSILDSDLIKEIDRDIQSSNLSIK